MADRLESPFPLAQWRTGMSQLQCMNGLPAGSAQAMCRSCVTAFAAGWHGTPWCAWGALRYALESTGNATCHMRVTLAFKD